MKRILALILLFATLLSFTSCVSADLEAATLPTASAETETEETAPPKERPIISGVAEPLTWEKINAIPVANSQMTTDELRQIVLDFTRLQMTFPWQPNASVIYKIKEREVQINYGTVYGGCPYVSSNFSNLYQVMAYYDQETGILDTKTMGAAFANIMGNQCSSSTFWGWSRVCNTHDWRGTDEMVLKHGCIKVGPYQYDQSIETFAGQNTTKICNANGEQIMYQSYAATLPADGIVSSGDSGGHVRMVSEKPVVVYTGGVIDGEKSYLVYQDQQTNWTPITQSNGKPLRYQGGIDVKISFKQLFEERYVPFTFAELIGQDPVEKAEISIALEGDSVETKELLKTDITANYPISEIFVTVTDANGEVLFERTTKATGKSLCRYTFQLKDGNFMESYLSKYKGKAIAISARVSTGETLPVWEGSLA